MDATIRYLRIFGGVTLTTIVLLVGFNALSGMWIARAPEARSLEMLSDYARVIKPYWWTQSDANIVAIGNSKVRDAFDPVLIRKQLGIDLFNYGVSGATAYETLRYTQDTLARSGVTTVIINADAFASSGVGEGFNEATLAVAPDGKPTPNRRFMLAATRLLSGGAVALHARTDVLLARLGGADASTRPDLFESYDRLSLAGLRRGQRSHETGSMAMTPQQVAYMNRTFDLFCRRRVRAFVYFAPDHFSITALEAKANLGIVLAFRHAVIAGALQHNRTCGADIRVFDFMRLNRVTGERLQPGHPSRYYREPVHVRPPVGVMMLQRMLGGRALAAVPDFGLEIAAVPGTRNAVGLREDLIRWSATLSSTAENAGAMRTIAHN